MSDDNAELVARLARRPEDVEYHAYQRANEAPTVYSSDWNVPIDTIQADSMTEREIIRGMVARAKDVARRWEPRPCPPNIDVFRTEE